MLGALSYIGRSFAFDHIEDVTAISEEVHCCFFHQFIEIGSTILYDCHVRAPTKNDEAMEHMAEFDMAGMTGALHLQMQLI